MFKQPLILPSVVLHSSAFIVLHVYEPKLDINVVASSVCSTLCLPMFVCFFLQYQSWYICSILHQ